MIHFSFFKVQFFTISLKITTPKQNIKNEKELFPEQRNKIYFAATIRNNFSNNVPCLMRSFAVPAYTLKSIEEYITAI